MEPKSPADSLAVMTQMILPSDANPLNAAFGERAAFQAAHLRRHARLERKVKASDWQRLLEP